MAEQIHTVTVSVISRHVICRKVDCMPELMCGDVSVIAGQQVDSDDYIQTHKQLHCHDKNEWNWAKNQILHGVLFTAWNGVILLFLGDFILHTLSCQISIRCSALLEINVHLKAGRSQLSLLHGTKKKNKILKEKETNNNKRA